MPLSPNMRILQSISEAMSDCGDESRRARKRATDRKSQRNHRERQKAYIQHLEKSLATFKAAAESDQRVSNLVAEIDRLQAKCNSQEVQLARVRAAVCDPPDHAIEQRLVQEPDSTFSLDHDDFRLSDRVEDFTAAGKDLPPMEVGTCDADESLSAGDGSLSLQDFSMHTIGCNPPARDGNLQVATPSQDLPGVELMQSAADMATEQLFTMLTPTQDSLVPLADVCLVTYPSTCLPRYTAAAGAADRFLLAMLEEARAEHRRGSFDMTKPSLRRLLSTPACDTLAFRLFHYIKSYGSMPLHLFLSIFWVQYLYLRWHVLETTEAYDQIPSFMRPTPIEYQIPHRISINMMVWPDLRQMLIRDALTADPDAIGIDLMNSLHPHWQPTCAIGSEFLVSLDILGMIEQQACSREFWKVDQAFSKKYYQYNSCDLF